MVEAAPGYASADQKGKEKLIKEMAEGLYAYVLMHNSDQDKYGSMLKHLHEQKALKIDNFPRTLIDATNALNDHEYDQAHKDKMKNKQKQKQANREKDEEGDEDLP